MPQIFEHAANCVEAVVAAVGRDIRLAIPVGIGKPNLFVNALYARAARDPSIRLRIFTGLSLVRPHFDHDLERRLVQPLLDRLFPTYPDLAYAEAIRDGALPPNVEVHEFFLQAGEWLSVPAAQQNYVSLNYADVAAHLERLGVNVLAQLVAPDPTGARTELSLSSNPDVTLDLLPYVDDRIARGLPTARVGELNDNLPYMLGQGMRPFDHFDFVLAPPRPHFELFAPPKMPVSLADHAAAIRTAALVKDGGTLQIGIGTFGDALCHALVLRQTRNDAFRDLVARLGLPDGVTPELDTFTDGLYGASEILVDGFLALRAAGILKRRVVRVTDAPRAAVVHAAFFIGNRAFYEALRSMPEDERAEIDMVPVSYTNTFDGAERERRLERRDGRFVNTTMHASLMGAVASDQLADGRVVSGIGGQHDFVAMAHRLPDARSILVLNAVRRRDGKLRSNIFWQLAHTSIPRQLRDMVVTEYGVADLRGKSDRDVIVAMLEVADSAFQDGLRGAAVKAGKLEPGFELAARYRENSEHALAAVLGAARRDGLLPIFPLGSDMTPVEQEIATALARLKGESLATRIGVLARGFAGPVSEAEQRALARMQLVHPATFREKLHRAVLLGALRQHDPDL